MNTEVEQLLAQHKQEQTTLKSQMFDVEKRLVELGGIIAALERVKQLSTPQAGNEPAK